jgi:ABC-type glycerol-3-phosphate transport system substrate-binding protein
LDAKGAEYRAFPQWLTSEELMKWVVTISSGQFVDWNEGTCDFETQSFYDWLELCKSAPVQTAEQLLLDYDPSTLLVIQHLFSPQYLKTLSTNYEGEDYCFIGFPNDDGSNGSYFSAGGDGLWFAISQGCENKDAAWQFLRSMLTVDYQSGLMGNPIRQDVL